MEAIILIGSFMLETLGGIGQIFTIDTPGIRTFTVMCIFLIIGYILDRIFPHDRPTE